MPHEPHQEHVMPHIVALVPMRHNSERVKGKNYRPLGGRPLYHHIVASLLDCAQIDEVVIDTDSPFIAADAEAAFPKVRVLPRPDYLLGGDIPMNEILLHDIEQVEADLYVQTHSTNPLLRAETIECALSAFMEASDRHDSLFTVTPLYTRLWTPDGRAINHDPEILLRTQDLPPVMEENSCLYIFDADTLRRRRNRIGERPLLYPLDSHEAWDIDEELDWLVVEALHAEREAVR
jgi:CMP-N-acetylneuraminic acid synthetase